MTEIALLDCSSIPTPDRTRRRTRPKLQRALLPRPRHRPMISAYDDLAPSTALARR